MIICIEYKLKPGAEGYSFAMQSIGGLALQQQRVVSVSTVRKLNAYLADMKEIEKMEIVKWFPLPDGATSNYINLG